MHDKIMQIIFDKDDVTWQTIIYELVKTEQMDPWDVNVSLIAERFLEMVRQLKEMDFRISGKVILAAAILLKIKAIRLVRDDITDFDKLLIATEEMSEEQFYGDLENPQARQEGLPEEDFQLVPRTPQPRKRKVSVYDLVAALQKALEVKHRRIIREIPEIKVHLPEYHVDIDVIITKLYERIENYFKKKGTSKLTFSQLVPSDDRIDKVMTFIPLLHLTSQRKIDMEQEQHFGEIEIMLYTPKPVEIEIEEENSQEKTEKKSKAIKTKNANSKGRPKNKLEEKIQDSNTSMQENKGGDESQGNAEQAENGAEPNKNKAI